MQLWTFPLNLLPVIDSSSWTCSVFRETLTQLSVFIVWLRMKRLSRHRLSFSFLWMPLVPRIVHVWLIHTTEMAFSSHDLNGLIKLHSLINVWHSIHFFLSHPSSFTCSISISPRICSPQSVQLWRNTFDEKGHYLYSPTSIDNSPTEMQMFPFKPLQFDNSSRAMQYFFSNIQQVILWFSTIKILSSVTTI